MSETLAEIMSQMGTPAWRAFNDSSGYMVFEQAADPPRSEPRSRWDKLLRIPERVYPTNRFTITFRGKVVGSATTLEKAKDRITEHRATGDPVPFWENPVAYTAPATELADQIESD